MTYEVMFRFPVKVPGQGLTNMFEADWYNVKDGGSRYEFVIIDNGTERSLYVPSHNVLAYYAKN